jgi:hypothetical protein
LVKEVVGWFVFQPPPRPSATPPKIGGELKKTKMPKKLKSQPPKLPSLVKEGIKGWFDNK